MEENLLSSELEARSFSFPFKKKREKERVEKAVRGEQTYRYS